MGHVWTWLESKEEFFTESEKSSSYQSFCSSPDSSLDLELQWRSWREVEKTDEEDLEESSSQEENGRSEIGDIAACEKVSMKDQEEAEKCKEEVVLQFISEVAHLMEPLCIGGTNLTQSPRALDTAGEKNGKGGLTHKEDTKEFLAHIQEEEEVAVENIEEQVEDSDFHMSYGNDDTSPCGTSQMSSPSTSTSSLPLFSGPFLKAVSERQAPGYNEVVKRPMDLSSIKRNLSKGQIQNMIELQRDLMLMFQNAIMYNSSNHHIHRIAVEMQREVLEQLQMLGEVLLCSEEMQGFLRGVEDPDY
ncbi:bromodomain-containing protein 8-like [Anolis sagrei]|uniref:bromodomain-containing protein 8-like n=1 Tax=Anolis sagrei TaxID=38937 RepID=UPI00351FD9BD